MRVVAVACDRAFSGNPRSTLKQEELCLKHIAASTWKYVNLGGIYAWDAEHHSAFRLDYGVSHMFPHCSLSRLTKAGLVVSLPTRYQEQVLY